MIELYMYCTCMMKLFAILLGNTCNVHVIKYLEIVEFFSYIYSTCTCTLELGSFYIWHTRTCVWKFDQKYMYNTCNIISISIYCCSFLYMYMHVVFQSCSATPETIISTEKEIH